MILKDYTTFFSKYKIEKNYAEKNMSISFILVNIWFQGGNTDITGKKNPTLWKYYK